MPGKRPRGPWSIPKVFLFEAENRAVPGQRPDEGETCHNM